MASFHCRSMLSLLFVALRLFLFSAPRGVCAASVGGEFAAYHLHPASILSPAAETLEDTVPRQNLCGRYLQVQNGTLELRDALRGMELRPLMRVGSYFHYTAAAGIATDDPGFMAVLLDELGRRAGFSWRSSFGVTYGLPNTASNVTNDDVVSNMTFSDLLVWGVDHYDLACNWWDETLERLERGASFLRPWFDGSLVLIDKRGDAVVDTDTVSFFNWSRPFTPGVWLMTLFTIITSGLTFQWLEHLTGQRENRKWWRWFFDNLYLSFLNFPQNYEFRPTTLAGQLFGVSISFWALVMTATYTANLASLLVDRKTTTVVIESLEDALVLGAPLCVYANTGMDQHIQTRYRSARRVPLDSELATFQALQEGRCDITVAYYQNWLRYARNRTYNPTCDLEWVGRTVKTIQSGFAVKADAGYKCSSLIRDVLNIYLEELFASGYMDDLWDAEYSKTQDINCDDIRPQVLQEASDEDTARRRQLLRQGHAELLFPHQKSSAQFDHADKLTTTATTYSYHERSRRRLKTSGRSGAAGGAAAAAAAAGNDPDAEERLTLNQMAGTFILHFSMSIIAVLLAYVSRYRKASVRVLRKSIHSFGSTMGRKRSQEESSSSNDGDVRNCKQLRDESKTSSSAVESHSEVTHKDSAAAPAAPADAAVTSHDNGDAPETATGGVVSVEQWQRTLRELGQAQRELRQTRRDMNENMNKIVSMLSDLQRKPSTPPDTAGWNPSDPEPEEVYN